MRGGLGSPNFGVLAYGNEELRRAICAAWRRLRRGKEGETGEEFQGLLYARGERRNGRALGGNLIGEGSYCGEETVTSVVTGRRWKKTGNWGPLVSEWKREGCTGSGFFLPGLRAGSPSGPKGFPEVQFHIFLLFSSFLFLVSLFKHNFCKSASIQTKLLPEIFKKDCTLF
jgi:hypothetical protein